MSASRLAIAEKFIRRGSGSLYRHYCISEVRSNVKQFTGVGITDTEAVSIVQKIRDEYGMGPIADYSMPGYIEEE